MASKLGKWLMVALSTFIKVGASLATCHSPQIRIALSRILPGQVLTNFGTAPNQDPLQVAQIFGPGHFGRDLWGAACTTSLHPPHAGCLAHQGA
jgi:hypothetical protein